MWRNVFLDTANLVTAAPHVEPRADPPRSAALINLSGWMCAIPPPLVCTGNLQTSQCSDGIDG